MLRFTVVSVVLSLGAVVAAPDPAKPDAKALVAQLSDPDEAVRDEASAALKDRADAVPWVRRAGRDTAPIISARAAKLLAPFEKARQGAGAKAINACVRDGHIELLMEWHHYWQPANTDDLWSVGPRAAKAGLDLYAKTCPKQAWTALEKDFASLARLQTNIHDGPCPERFEGPQGVWLIRTDRIVGKALRSELIRFLSVAGPVRIPRSSGHLLALGPIQASAISGMFAACVGDVSNGALRGVEAHLCFAVCRGRFVGHSHVHSSVILAEGDIDLTAVDALTDSLIRATGNIKLPKNVKPENCTIEANAKEATAPYKFFALADVGVSVTSAKGGVVVTGVTPKTPFGESGLKVGDLIRAIDDAPAKNADEFRTQVRRAVVRQGDCLLTVERDSKALELPAFFPLPK